MHRHFDLGPILSNFGHKSLVKELRKAEKKNNKDAKRAAATEATVMKIADVYSELITKPLADGAYALAKCTPTGAEVKIFSDGTAFGVNDADGNILIPAMFDSITKFNSDGIAEVTVNGVTGYVNEHGFISYPLQLLTFSKIAPLKYTISAINTALSVYPTNTYAWLTAAYSIMHDVISDKVDYYTALRCYDMALEMADVRDEMYYISEEDWADRRKAQAYVDGIIAPKEQKTESSGWNLAADLLNSVANLTTSIQEFKNPTATFESISDYEISNVSSSSRGSSKSSGASLTKSSTYGSLPETTAMNSDKRVYGHYETQLIKMRSGVDEYNDSRRQDIQSKMKQIRTKWEKKGYKFYHSEVEDWIKK